MSNSLIEAAVFLLDLISDIFLYLLLLRLVLQMVKANFYNPFCQFIVKITNPLLVPCRRIIPGYFGIDMAAIALAFIIQVLTLLLLTTLTNNVFTIVSASIITLGLLIEKLMYLYFIAIFAGVIISWVVPYTRHPMIELIHQITFPVLQTIRKKVPTIYGIDFSPLIAIVFIQLINILVVKVIIRYGNLLTTNTF